MANSSSLDTMHYPHFGTVLYSLHPQNSVVFKFLFLQSASAPWQLMYMSQIHRIFDETAQLNS